ncbi:hypothetical protein WMY93_020895 [Mugilogobius chulae]|uniref:TIR domain-containing protein n=1 Tax=Mugilogobius chulae TaxID=88201 RepID=A0AAW0NCB9_9GOBI
MSTLDNSLQSCSQLTHLDLSFNSLTNITPDALQMLTHLSELNFGGNDVTSVPLTIRNMSSLRSLSLAFNLIQKLDCLDFSGLWLLTELVLKSNKLVELNSCVFQDLHNLQTLDVSLNRLHEFDDSFILSLPNLLVLVAEKNNIEKLQKGVFKNMSKLTDLKLDAQRGIDLEMGTWDGLTNLRNLIISPAFLYDSNFFNLPMLDTLHFSVSDTKCFWWQNDVQSFKNLTFFLSEEPFCDSHSFVQTPHLLHLEVKNNEIWRPDAAFFQPITALQTLDLSQNHLTSLDFLLEANLTQLQKLILRSNDLSVINVEVFEALPSLQYLDLWGNPFTCNCSNADFIHWAIFNRQVYVNRAFQYKCASPASHLGALLLEFNFRWCWEFAGFVCFVSSSALVLLTLLCSFIHHFLRVSLLYSFYLLRAFLYHRQRQGCAEVYDAFVSYNVHDEEWVYRELVPELEERQGWRLCLHHRDFQPGKAIMENITDAIYSSRKTLCVISQQYLHSEWCSREIQMARYDSCRAALHLGWSSARDCFRLLDEKKDVLVLLFLEELSSNQLSPFFRMRKLLRRRTYVSWSGARGHRGLFWEKVRRALQSGTELPAEGLLPPDV